MTWEWSHTPEAYCNVRDNIADQSHEWLVIVWAEWKTHGATPRSDEEDADVGDEAFDEDKYKQFLAEAETMPDDCMADEIYEWASELRNCTNGGWEAHCCPYGCGCHMVPFDREEPETHLDEPDPVIEEPSRFGPAT